MPQNIYDDPVFFEEFKKVRKSPVSHNELLEGPALRAMLPSLAGKRVLDLGCGMGENCRMFKEAGAAFVQGVDISRRMLEVALGENALPGVAFLRMGLEELHRLQGNYDLVVSSLVFQYVEDFGKLMKDIHRLLVPGGLLVFSQEHPVDTGFSGGERWTRDGEGRVTHANVMDYGRPGPREIPWIVDRVELHHRTLSQIFNTIIDSGFIIEAVGEPFPGEEDIKKIPKIEKELHRPVFLLVRARAVRPLWAE